MTSESGALTRFSPSLVESPVSQEPDHNHDQTPGKHGKLAVLVSRKASLVDASGKKGSFDADLENRKQEYMHD